MGEGSLRAVVHVSGSREQLLHVNMQWFWGGLVLDALELFVSLNSKRESNEEEEVLGPRAGHL
jgi:hypothetical protein